MAGKKEIAAALFSFIYDNYLMNTPTPIIKDALRKVNALIITLDDEKEEKPKEIQLKTETECSGLMLKEALILEPKIIITPEMANTTNEIVIETKKARAPRKDKGMKRCSTLPT